MNDLERGSLVEPIPVPQMEVPTKEYRPSNQEALRDYEINIKFLNRGCVVQVGCKSIAFEDVGTAMQAINDYVCGDTYEEHQKWRKLLD